jgi:hypothetical protein
MAMAYNSIPFQLFDKLCLRVKATLPIEHKKRRTHDESLADTEW